MDSLQFQYEISFDDFVSANLLYLKLHGSWLARGWFALRMLLGVTFVVIAANATLPASANNGSSVGLAIVLLAFVGLYWVFSSCRILLFRKARLRRSYSSSLFAGESFSAFMDQTSFRVEGEYREWSIKWSGVASKGENKQVFIFVSGGIIFIFGKKFLTSEQQGELRRLSGMQQV